MNRKAIRLSAVGSGGGAILLVSSLGVGTAHAGSTPGSLPAESCESGLVSCHLSTNKEELFFKSTPQEFMLLLCLSHSDFQNQKKHKNHFCWCQSLNQVSLIF